MHTLPELDPVYARAVLDSRETPQRWDDAMARIDAGHVSLGTVYRAERGVGTPLHLAVLENELAYVDELLARGADPNARYEVEPGMLSAPMLFAARSIEALRRLVAGGARLDAASFGGESYLQHCVRMTRVSGHPVWQQLAREAIALGADPKQKNDAGQDAAAFARAMGVRIGKAYAPLFGLGDAPARAPEAPKPARRRIAR